MSRKALKGGIWGCTMCLSWSWTNFEARRLIRLRQQVPSPLLGAGGKGSREGGGRREGERDNHNRTKYFRLSYYLTFFPFFFLITGIQKLPPFWCNIEVESGWERRWRESERVREREREREEKKRKRKQERKEGYLHWTKYHLSKRFKSEVWAGGYRAGDVPFNTLLSLTYSISTTKPEKKKKLMQKGRENRWWAKRKHTWQIKQQGEKEDQKNQQTNKHWSYNYYPLTTVTVPNRCKGRVAQFPSPCCCFKY